jgi:RloB-like protein
MRKNRKTRPVRIPYKSVLILCEGLTEKQYLQSIKNTLPRNKQRGIKIDIECYKKRDPKNLVIEASRRKHKAKKEGVAYQNVWVVFDHDNLPDRDVAFRQAMKEKIQIAFTSISIEVWFLMHFKPLVLFFTNGDSAKRHLAQNHIPNYQPGKTNIWDHLGLKRTNDAIINAKQIRIIKEHEIQSGANIWDLNPYTTLDKLVEFLLISK